MLCRSSPRLAGRRSSPALRQPAQRSAAAAQVQAPGAGSLRGQSIISAGQFDRPKIEELLRSAQEMSVVLKKGGSDTLKHRILGNLFYEPSTRTASSFHAAMLRLGGSVISVSSATSSAQKGETLADTIRVMENYVDAIVLRHAQSGAAAEASRYTKKPVINAGDGPNEHPTQALLDLHAINTELGSLDGLTICLVGDLKYGRTVHSLIQLLDHFKLKQLNLVAPPSLQIPREFLAKAKNIKIQETADMASVLATSDVVYQTRIQKERFADLAEYESLKGTYVVAPETMAVMKKKSMLLHPLPRVDEIKPDVDLDPRAAYFRQPRYGLEMRMAILQQAMAK